MGSTPVKVLILKAFELIGARLLISNGANNECFQVVARIEFLLVKVAEKVSDITKAAVKMAEIHLPQVMIAILCTFHPSEELCSRLRTRP